MTTSTSLRRRIRRSGDRMVLMVRLVLAVLVAAPFVVLALLGVDDWHHVGPQSVTGVATSTHCTYDEFGEVSRCVGDFSSDDGTVVLPGVELRLETALAHTGPASAAPTDGSWVAVGTGRARMVPLLVRQLGSVSLVWFVVYAVTIVGLIGLLLAWTARQVGRVVAAVDHVLTTPTPRRRRAARRVHDP